MTPKALATLHECCFTLPRPWSANEFNSLLKSPHVFLITDAHGFLLGRATAGEAELLTLAVASDARRSGIGEKLTLLFANQARQRDATEAFLEVASNNYPAQALYTKLGWKKAGIRPGYYAQGIDALTLHLEL